MAKIKTYVTRGNIVESIHESKCLILDNNNKVLYTTNHQNDLIYPRSAMKVFQAIPFIVSKAHKKYRLTEKQIAISCSSHYGEQEHIKVIKEWIKKLGINEKQLLCGIHNPLNLLSSNKLLLSGTKPRQIHNNCAGKHLGMMSACLMYGYGIKDYVNLNHPYQILIRKILKHFMQCQILQKHKGIDGCSAPQYAFPLKNLSIAMINLIKTFNEESKYTNEVRLILNSIKKYPTLTGSKTKYDSQLMLATNGKIFAKWGAEGVLMFAHKHKKVGGVIKVKDGNERALPSVSNEILKKLKIINSKELKKLSNWSNQQLYNHAKIKIGNIFTILK